MARVWQLLVRADGDTKAAQKELRALQRSTQKFGRNMQGMGRTMTTAVTAPIVALGALGVSELRETMEVTKKTDAVFKSMGASMKVTKGQLSKLVGDLERYSAVEGDIIQNAANVGLSFKALAGNPKLFAATTKAAIDMSAALGIDTQQAMVQLGKAMQNGAKGAGALAKNGTLAKDDIAKLQKMAKDGLPLWKQQEFILKAVNQQYAGQGKNVDPIKSITIAVKNTAETLAVLLLPALQRVSGFLQKVATRVSGMSDEKKKLVGIVLLLSAALGPVLIAMGTMVTAFAALIPFIAGISLPLVAVVAGITALGVALVLAYKKSETFRTFVGYLWTALKNSPIGMLVKTVDGFAQKLGGWKDVFRYAGIAALGFAKVVLTMALGVTRAINDLTQNWLQKFSSILKAVAFIRPEFKAAAAAVGAMSDRSRDSSSKMERAMTRDIKKIDRTIKDLKKSIDAVPSMKRVSISVEQRVTSAGGAGVALPTGPTSRASLGKAGTSKVAASGALSRAQAQARIDADAEMSLRQATNQYNAQVAAIAAIRKGGVTQAEKTRLSAANARLEELARNLVEKRSAAGEARAAREKAEADALAASTKAAADFAEAVDDARRDGFAVPPEVVASNDAEVLAKWLDTAQEQRADLEKQIDADKKAAQDARDAENFRRRALGMMSVEEEIELAAANEIRAKHGLPPVSSMSDIGSNPTEATTPLAAGDTGAGFNQLAPTSNSALQAVQTAATRIAINMQSGDPEAVARRIAFILGGTRLRMGGGI